MRLKLQIEGFSNHTDVFSNETKNIDFIMWLLILVAWDTVLFKFEGFVIFGRLPWCPSFWFSLRKHYQEVAKDTMILISWQRYHDEWHSVNEVLFSLLSQCYLRTYGTSNHKPLYICTCTIFSFQLWKLYVDSYHELAISFFINIIFIYQARHGTLLIG